MPAGGEGDDSDELEMVYARQAVQAIVTCHVVLRDLRQRDGLITEAIEEYGVRVPKFIAGFICSHATDGVETEQATDRFYFVLSRLGRLIALQAEIAGRDERDLLFEMVATDWVVSQADEATEEERERFSTAMRAAQTCLIAHHYVRRGRTPWGIQATLDLNDMCAVLEMFGHLLFDIVEEFPEEHWPRLIHELLDDVGAILAAQASANDRPLSAEVAQYFTRLARRDANTTDR